MSLANAATECLAIAWLIGCLGPSVPVPAPFLTGPQGAGKFTGGRMLGGSLTSPASPVRAWGASAGAAAANGGYQGGPTPGPTSPPA